MVHRMKKSALLLALVLLLSVFGVAVPAGGARAAADPVTWRGLFVGCGDYAGTYNDLAPGTLNDAHEAGYVFSNAAYDGTSRARGAMTIRTNIGRSTLLGLLNTGSTSSPYYGADANDVSIFFFSGHGATSGGTSIVLSDGSSDGYLTVNDLEAALREVPGTKVVILDCCYSGGIIGKSAESAPSASDSVQSKDVPATDQESFAQALLEPFAGSGRVERALLNQPSYVVFTASSGSEVSYGEAMGEDDMGFFTRAFTDGLGRYGSYAADADANKTVTAQEAYQSSLSIFSSYYGDLVGASTAQYYAADPSFTLLKYDKAGAKTTGKAKSAVDLYSSTLASKASLLRLSAQQEVKIYGTFGSYYKASARDSDGNTFIGYVHKESVSLPGSTPTPAVKRNGVAKARITTCVYATASSSGKKLRTLNAGNLVDLIGASGTYYKVSVSGVTGYVYSGNLVIVSGSSGLPSIGTVKTKTKTYVYATASSSGTRLLTLNSGKQITVYGGSGKYFRIIASGYTGYVPASAVSVTSGSIAPYPTANYMLGVGKVKRATWLYKSQSTSGTRLRTLAAGQTAVIVWVSSKYYNCWINGQVGFVPRSEMDIVSGKLKGGAPKSTKKSLNVTGRAVAASPVYASTSTSSRVVLRLKKNSTFTALSVAGSFYKMKKSGKTGYIPAGNASMNSKRLSAAGKARNTCYIYADHSAKSAKKLTLKAGAYVSIIQVQGSYYTVWISGVKGYVPTKDIAVI